jgi:hypothetical protein
MRRALVSSLPHTAEVVMMAVVNTIRFDVEILRTCPEVTFPDARAFAAAALAQPFFWTRLGFAGVDLSLPDARLLPAAIRAASGAALIVPSAYRTPMVSLTAARRIAEQRLEILRLRCGGSFGPLEDGEAHSMWWRFYADYSAPLGDAAEPELVVIDVDMIDGHIATLADERQLAQWQQDWPAAPDVPPSRRHALTARRGAATRRAPDPASPPAPPRRHPLSLVRTEPR